MDEINHLLTMINPAYFEGAGAVIIILLIYKFIKKDNKKSSKKKIPNNHNKKKSSEHKQTANNQEVFDPQTYTVETEEDFENNHTPQAPVIRPQIFNLKESLIETENMVSQKKNTPNPLYLLDLAKSLDFKNDKTGAIHSLQAAIKIQDDPIEKLIYERILLTYSQNNDRTLRELLNNKDSFLNEDNIFSPIKELPNFQGIQLKKAVNPNQVTISLNSSLKPNEDDINTDNLDSFVEDNPLSKFEFKSDKYYSTEDYDTNNAYSLLAEAIDKNTFDTETYALEDLRMNDNDKQQNLTHHVWVHWMTVANGKTSFKSNTLHLKNPWSGKKAILEITDILNSTSKNADGTNAPWAILSVTPYYDDL